MFFVLGKTEVSKVFQARLKALGLTRETLKAWARKHGFFPYEYRELWGAVWGWRVPRECFLVRLALQMGMDPHQILLAAAADRAPRRYKDFFLAVGEALAPHPDGLQHWQRLDVETRQALLQLIGEPERARWLMQRYRLKRQTPLP